MVKISLKSRVTRHTDLSDRVDACSPADPVPLVHVTEIGYGRDIILSGQLEARFCDVFGRDLLYFFLGRPAYRLKHEETASRKITRYPIVFVADPKRVAATQSFPFDTGALSEGIYTNADPHLAIEDYQLNGAVDGALRQLSFAFQNVDDYFAGRLRVDIEDDLPAFAHATRSYIEIAKMATHARNRPGAFDDRASAIEVATDRHLDLKGAIEMVILPKQYLEGPKGGANAEIVSQLSELDIETDTYDWDPTKTPADYRAEINSKVLAFIKSKYHR